jgi:hypothetical protein
MLTLTEVDFLIAHDNLNIIHLNRMPRSYAQISSLTKNFLTIINTVWLFPTADITAALATTTYSYTFNGDVITCPDMANLIGVYNDIFAQTTISQPVGNAGFSLGVGTFLVDLGDELRFALEGGAVVVLWRLVKQISPQTTPPIAVPGNSPNGTIGYVPTFVSFGNGTGGGYSVGLDDVLVVRVG